MLDVEHPVSWRLRNKQSFILQTPASRSNHYKKQTPITYHCNERFRMSADESHNNESSLSRRPSVTGRRTVHKTSSSTKSYHAHSNGTEQESSSSSQPDTIDTASAENASASNSENVQHDVSASPSNAGGHVTSIFTQLRHKPRIIATLAALFLILAASIAFAIYSAPITITVNGSSLKITGLKTVQAAFTAAGEPAQAGNLVDVEGEILEEGQGERFSFTLNGQEGSSASAWLSDGDEVEFFDGDDIEEESESSEISIPFDTIDQGNGTIHVLESEGSEGTGISKTGKISGKTVTQVITEPQDRVYCRYSPDVGDDKVIALTFDDGPWDTYTAEILDILEENDAKATFFTVGSRITDDKADLVKQAAAAGHQICTHTWDHASGSGNGVNLAYMSAEEQREEITKGLEAIEEATGETASTVIRAPGGNFPTEVWQNVDDLITADIGWNIDTKDWSKPGVSAIVKAIESASSGDIILMHDGGGDRSQTVEALSKALPYLKKKGYTFITIDELLEYPEKDS